VGRVAHRASPAIRRAGKAAHRAGKADRRAGNAAHRAGKAARRAGKADRRAGNAAHRAGKAAHRAGKADRRAGNAAHRAGKAAHRADRANRRVGNAAHRAGKADRRVGNAAHRAGRANRRAGKADRRVGNAAHRAGRANRRAGPGNRRVGNAAHRAGRTNRRAGPGNRRAGSAAHRAGPAIRRTGSAAHRAGLAIRRTGSAAHRAGLVNHRAGNPAHRAGHGMKETVRFAADKIYDTEGPEEIPAYRLPDAAHIVRLSPSTLRLWACGEGARKPLFKPASRTPLLLSFSNLVEGFVLAAMRRVHRVSMQRVRKALRYVGNELGYSRPLIHARFRTDGVSLFVQHAGKLLDVSAEGQAVLRDVLEESLARIDWERDLAVRLYPWVRGGDLANQPKTIVVDPRLGFGQPVIAGTGIEARIVAERYRAGEPTHLLAEDYRVSVEQIEDSIRCEMREAA
jgi:uncharacterized protein (DUF433 family)